MYTYMFWFQSTRANNKIIKNNEIENSVMQYAEKFLLKYVEQFRQCDCPHSVQASAGPIEASARL